MILETLKKQGIDHIQEGRSLLTKQLAEFGIKPHTRLINKLMAAYHVGSKEELFGRIGAGMLDLSGLRDVLLKGTPSRKFVTWIPSPDWKRRKDFNAFHFAPCCRPTKDDELIGFIDRKTHDLYIHSVNCTRIEALKRLHRNDNASVNVLWKKQHLSSTLAKLNLRGQDRMGIIHEITRTVSLTLCVNIRSFQLVAHDNVFDGELEVYVQKETDLDNLVDQLKKIKGIETVKPE